MCSQRLSLADWLSVIESLSFPTITSYISSVPGCLIYLFSFIPTYSLSALVTTLPTSAFPFPCSAGKNNYFTTFCIILCSSLPLRSIYYHCPQQYPSSVCISNFFFTVYSRISSMLTLRRFKLLQSKDRKMGNQLSKPPHASQVPAFDHYAAASDQAG